MSDRGKCGAYGRKAFWGEEAGGGRISCGFFPEKPAFFLHTDRGAAGDPGICIAIIAIYVVATFFAGFVAGKRMESRRFLWGLVMGCAYFLVLAVVSFAAGKGDMQVGSSFFTTLVLCAGGGMLGGMLS